MVSWVSRLVCLALTPTLQHPNYTRAAFIAKVLSSASLATIKGSSFPDWSKIKSADTTKRRF